MNSWLDDFAKRSSEIASRRRVPIEAPYLNAGVARELLDLTREVAHIGERQFAPLAAFIVGQTVERMARANPALNDQDVVEYLQELTQAIPRKEAAE